MSHELEFNEDGSAKMFYATEDGPPWHGFGTPVDDAPTAKEAIKLAGQDWLTEVGPLRGGPNMEILQDFRCIYRVSDGKVLGTCGTGYQPIQNWQCFDFLDGLVKDRVMHYATAGVLFGGKRIWILAKLEEDMIINSDRHEKYVALVSWHDGGRALRAYFTSVRIVCNNTVEASLGGAGASGISIVHTGDTEAKLKAAQDVLRISTQGQERYAKWLESLAQTEVTNEQTATVQEALFGSLDDSTSTQRRNKIELWKLMLHAEEEKQGQNGYSLLQSLTGYGNYGIKLSPRADRSQRFLSMFGGKGSDWNTQAAAVVASVTGVERV